MDTNSPTFGVGVKVGVLGRLLPAIVTCCCGCGCGVIVFGMAIGFEGLEVEDESPSPSSCWDDTSSICIADDDIVELFGVDKDPQEGKLPVRVKGDWFESVAVAVDVAIIGIPIRACTTIG